MFDPEIRQAGPMSVAFLAMRGPYAQIPEAMGRLYGRVAQQGLVPIGAPTSVYLTDPRAVSEQEARWELWAPVAGEPDAQPIDQTGFGVKVIEGGTVAVAIHVGPFETIDQTYGRLTGWLAGQGREIVGPPREACLSDPAETAPAEYRTEIQLPVR